MDRLSHIVTVYSRSRKIQYFESSACDNDLKLFMSIKLRTKHCWTKDYAYQHLWLLILACCHIYGEPYRSWINVLELSQFTSMTRLKKRREIDTFSWTLKFPFSKKQSMFHLRHGNVRHCRPRFQLHWWNCSDEILRGILVVKLLPLRKNGIMKSILHGKCFGKKTSPFFKRGQRISSG